MKTIKIIIFLVALVFLNFIQVNQAQAVLLPASDLLGQYDGTSYTNPVPYYTKGGTNDGPNIFGYYNPTGMTLDSVNHRFFMSDTTNNRVLVYNLNTDNTFPDKFPDNVLGQANFTSNSSANAQSGMSAPVGLAYDSANNRLFVAESSSNRVKVFDVASITNGENAVNILGQANFTSNNSGNTQSGLSFPYGILYDSANNRLFVVESNGNRVKVFDVASITNGENAVNILGQANFTSNSAANTQSGLNTPRHIAYDSVNNRLFVSESSGNRVKVFDVASIIDGENAVNVLGQTNFTSNTSGLTQSRLASPYGLAYDSANNRLFVSESSNNRVLVFDVASITDGENAVNVLGQTNFTSGSQGAATQPGLAGPLGLTYDSANSRLFVAEGTGGNRVKIFDVASITNGENAVDLMGQYDNTSYTNPVVSYLKSTPNNGPNIFGYYNPTGMTLDSVNHRFFVSDTTNNRVLVYNLNTDNTFPDKFPDNVLGQSNFIASATGLTQSTMNQPANLVFDSVGNRLFVSDSNNYRILVFDVASITNGENAVNVLGQADFFSRVSQTTQSSLYFGSLGLALDSVNNRLFASDPNNNRVLVFDVASITNGENAINVLGQTDFVTGTLGLTQSKFTIPRGLAFDSVGNRLFVSDTNNSRVLVFDVASITDGENAVNVLGQTDFITGYGFVTQSGMNNPQGLSYDSTKNRLFVADTNNSRVTIFDVASITNGENAVNVLGQVNFTSGTGTTTQSSIAQPVEAIFDENSSKLFVVSMNENRILIFNLTSPTVVTQSASSINLSSVILNANMSSIGAVSPTIRGFQYGLDTNYGTTSTENGSFGIGTFSASISSLTCGTTYHYRAYATSSVGTGYGDDTTFATNACPNAPSVQTSPATSITDSTVSLNGEILSTDLNATVRGFYYGLDTDYTNGSVEESGSFGIGTFSASISSLTCGTTYHYRSFAISGAGTGYGDDATFTTSACPTPPVVGTSTATSVTFSYAFLNGEILSTDLNATVRGFEYGLDTDYAYSSLDEYGDFGTGTFGLDLYNLTCETTYHYRAYAGNDWGSGHGDDATFTTSTCPPTPVIVTKSAVPYNTSAILVADITSNGGVNIMEYGFDYGLDTDYGYNTFREDFDTGEFGILAQDLSPDTTYHYRSYARNQSGTSYGEDKTFTTLEVVSPLVLYGVDGKGGNSNPPNLYILDSKTGNILSTVGPTGHNLTGIAFNPTNSVLYGVSGGQDPTGGKTKSLFTVNITAGTATWLGYLKTETNQAVVLPDISFKSDGTLYGFTNGWGGDPATADLYTVSLNSCDGTTDTNCLVTKVGDSGLSPSGGLGLTFKTDNHLYLFGNNDCGVFDLNPSTGMYSTNFWNNNCYDSPVGAATYDGVNIYGARGNDLFIYNDTYNLSVSLGNSSDMEFMDAIAFKKINPPVVVATPVIEPPGAVLISMLPKNPNINNIPVPTQTNTQIPSTNNQGTCKAQLTQTLKYGSVDNRKGISEVKKLQTLLNSHGFSSGAPDGYFMKKTQNAVKSFQKENNLTIDGIVGPGTRAVVNGKCWE